MGLTPLKSSLISTMRSPIVGCCCLTIRCESAQLAHCAAVRTRTALARPSPSAESATVERVCAAVRAFGVPKISREHGPHVLVASGLPASDFGGAAHEEEGVQRSVERTLLGQ